MVVPGSLRMRRRASRCGLSSVIFIVVAFGEDVGSDGGVGVAVGSRDRQRPIRAQLDRPSAFVDEVVVP